MTLAVRDFLIPVQKLARKAGKAIWDLYEGGEVVDVQIKADASPVTAADLLAHQLIVEGLQALTPNWPVLSEEAANIPYSQRAAWDYYWLVDPLDGTKEFIHRTGEFTVNIALISGHASVLGVVYSPFNDTSYWAAQGCGAYKQVAEEPPAVIQVRDLPHDEKVVLVSRRHGKTNVALLVAELGECRILHRGSSLKSCLVAEGAADIYLCLGKTSEWDTGAAQCIVEEAGGTITDLNLQSLQYNMRTSLINPPFLVVGDKNYPWKKIIQKFPEI